MKSELRKDPEIVEEVVQILSTLREGWAGLKNKQTARSEPEISRRVNLQT